MLGTLHLTAVLFVAVGATFASPGSSRAVVVLLIVGLLAAMLLLQEEPWQA